MQREVPDLPAGRPTAQPEQPAEAHAEQSAPQAGAPGEQAGQLSETPAERPAEAPWDPWRKAVRPAGQPTPAVPDERAASDERAAAARQPAEPIGRPVAETLSQQEPEPVGQPAPDPPSTNLSEARRRHGLPEYQAHDALTDAIATAELFLVMR